jgi:hypothetical protein
VIDLLGTSDKDVRYRIYYNDSASSPGKGIPQLDDDHPFDLAILCMASFHFVKDYPEGLLCALKPRHLRRLLHEAERPLELRAAAHRLVQRRSASVLTADG